MVFIKILISNDSVCAHVRARQSAGRTEIAGGGTFFLLLDLSLLLARERFGARAVSATCT